MHNNHTLNPSMKVLEHSASRLVLIDGSMLYSYGTIPSANNLIVQPLIAFAICTLVVFWLPGSSIGLAVTLGMMTAALQFTGLWLVRVYGGGRHLTYIFDKQVGTLTCSTPAIFPYRPPKTTCYRLNDIIAVESVTEANDDPPPLYWRSIKLRMPDKILKLSPGFDEAVQEHMADLLHTFIFRN